MQRLAPLFLAVALLTPAATVSAQEQTSPAKAIFDDYQTFERTYDVRIADLYCETALIRTIRISPGGGRRSIDIPARQWKDMVHTLMPTAKARGEYSTFSDIKYTPEGNNIRITATRYSVLKKYSAPHSVLIGACNGGPLAIIEELSESRP